MTIYFRGSEEQRKMLLQAELDTIDSLLDCLRKSEKSPDILGTIETRVKNIRVYTDTQQEEITS